MLARFRLAWLRFWGGLANLAGFPGVVREGEYQSELGVTVKVRKSALFTVVTVNGVDVFFYRLSGGIDGVGFSPTSDCTSFPESQSTDSVATPAHSLPRVRIAGIRRNTHAFFGEAPSPLKHFAKRYEPAKEYNILSARDLPQRGCAP